MKTVLYNKTLVAIAVCVAMLFATSVTAQEALHLFFKDGNHKQCELKPEMKIEFIKKAYIIEENYSMVSPDTIFMSADAGRSYHVGHIYSNCPLEIDVDVDWLMTRQADWKNNWSQHDYEYIFLVYSRPNTSDENRFATLTLTAGDYTKTFVVAQQSYVLGFAPNIINGRYDDTITPTVNREDYLTWNDTVFYADIFPNHGVKVISYPDWMTLDWMYNPGEGEKYSFEYIESVPEAQIQGVASGSGGASFTFMPNESPHSRSGKIVFEGHGQTAELTITQEGLDEETLLREAANLNKKLYNCMELNGGRHDDFGFPSIMLRTDSRGIDMVADNSGYNWFSDPMAYSDLIGNHTYYYWQTLYNQINTANITIKNYVERSGQPLFQFYLAQAYATRAFCYFYLAQMYQHTYIGNEDKPCVPIVTENNMDEQMPRASVKETYDFMIQDLDRAAYLLEQTSVKRPHKGFISKEVVYGLRARINMVTNNWTVALEDADRIINASVASPYTREEVSRPTFININDDAWLWGIDVEETDRAVTSNIVNFPSHMGSFSYGYAQVGGWRRISKALYNAIPETDVRKGWFLDGNCQSQNLTIDQTVYVGKYGMQPYTQVKFAPYNNELGTSINASDIPLMRIEEIYFIAAEAQARLGNLEASRNLLNTFVSIYRDPAYNCTLSTQDEILDAIWMQRRIELWGEGHSYFDLMRLNKGVDRRGAGFQTQYVFNIPATDAALIYPIPDSEMNKNMNLVNNPEATQPTPVEDY